MSVCVCVCVCVRACVRACVRVCLFVCLSAIVSSELHVRASAIFCALTYGRVVGVLDSSTEGPGFESQP